MKQLNERLKEILKKSTPEHYARNVRAVEVIALSSNEYLEVSYATIEPHFNNILEVSLVRVGDDRQSLKLTNDEIDVLHQKGIIH